jgi:hypothetical protein
MADNEKPKDKQQQDVEELTTWRKKIEMIGIDIKSLDIEYDYNMSHIKNNTHESAFYK